MAHPVLGPELDNIRNSSIAGGFCAAVAFFCAGTYVNYSTTLASSGVTLETATRGRFEAYATISWWLIFVFGSVALYLQVRIAFKVLRLKQTRSEFKQLENGQWIRVDPNPVLAGPSVLRKLWTKLRLKAHAKIDHWS